MYLRLAKGSERLGNCKEQTEIGPAQHSGCPLSEDWKMRPYDPDLQGKLSYRGRGDVMYQ